MSHCSMCRHWKRISQVLTEPGICRRYPPVPFLIPVQGGVNMQCHFPLLNPDGYCGEFASKMSNGTGIHQDESVILGGE